MDRSAHFGTYVKQIHDTLEKLANNDLRTKGLTVAQSQVLLHLASAEGGECSLKELEKVLKVAQSTVAGIVLRLEQKGFVTGHASPDDRRVKHVRISKAGRAVCDESLDDIAKTERRLFDCLTGEEADSFLALLKKICGDLGS